MGMAGANLGKGQAFVEASIQEQKIPLLEVVDELLDKFMFRGACLAVDEIQWRASDHIEEAAKFDADCPQSLLPVVSAESFP